MSRTTRQAIGATLLYGAATCALTWPLVTVIHRDIAADLGDPVLNCWILLWTSGQVFAFLSGDAGALARFWDGNIFFSEPLTLAYSEHLTAQLVQALPVLAATDNVILAYNLLFLSTFVLSGLGMFLLVRDLTGRPLAALVAGFAFAFAPYRIEQLPHLQVLSAQWMPFVLYGFRRYLETGRRRALVGGAAAWLVQNLSCGYYVMFFSPFVAIYVLYEMARRRRLADWATWRAFVAAGFVVSLATVPFLTPYLEVRQSGVGVRSIREITEFSADAHGFATAPVKSWLWGERLRTFRGSEGQAFPGFAILVLALTGIAGGFLSRRRRENPPLPAWRQVLTGALIVVAAWHLWAIVTVLVTGGYLAPAPGGWVIVRWAGPVFLGAGIVAVWLALLIRWPRHSPDDSGTPWVFYALAALAAALFAMGPQITVAGTPVSSGPYAWLMQYVPGFDGLRVPARFVMLVTLFLAVLAGLGASYLIARLRRVGSAFVVVASAFILVEAWPAPFEINVRLAAEGLNPTPRELRVADDLPPIYKAVRDNERPIILLEFPFGSANWDLQAVYYAGYHRQRLVNGYSGFFPESHLHLVRMFKRRREDPQGTWRALLSSGATHVLVHEAAFPRSRQKEITDWLLASGARETFVDGTDRMFSLR